MALTARPLYVPLKRRALCVQASLSSFPLSWSNAIAAFTKNAREREAKKAAKKLLMSVPRRAPRGAAKARVGGRGLHGVGNARAARRNRIRSPDGAPFFVPCLFMLFVAPRSPRVFFSFSPSRVPPRRRRPAWLACSLAQLASNFCVVLPCWCSVFPRFWPARLPGIRAGFEHFSFFLHSLFHSLCSHRAGR